MDRKRIERIKNLSDFVGAQLVKMPSILIKRTAAPGRKNMHGIEDSYDARLEGVAIEDRFSLG
jgi:hypothetical protein